MQVRFARAGIIVALLQISMFIHLATAAIASEADETSSARTAPLLEALAIDELVDTFRDEGVFHAEELQTAMFPGRGEERWPKLVADIYDPERMIQILGAELEAATKPWHIDPLVDFFDSELGRRILRLEISARQAFLEPGVEEASGDHLDLLRNSDPERHELLTEFAETNDLVEANVKTAINANMAFQMGLNNAGAFGPMREEGQMLREIWMQQDAIRSETARWLMSYLSLAYQPLSDAELQRYIDFSRSEAGHSLNHTLFVAFNELFQVISYDLGEAAAQFLAGEEL
ncbi:DUF2059 domain-containing protein [Tropicimonas sp. TH_r6]|uniref:DUF2059 domain-containing protein n=1 Tax=Tropicimonas sp. TH_r6 TaxID=3082085 RepID=UPI00295335B3|nr:DUF2059 domain-containing protein [Tropicimonas sp. TH_r6]MDV7141749.1 DUF2059 domain-containing protein [Tropicimonas sp. TH_r6]